MGRAQERFKAMLKEHVAPALRDLGFKGSGQTFVLPNEHCYASLGFQKWKGNDAERVSFTVNVSVVPKTAWAEFEYPRTGTTPSPNLGYVDSPVWQKRIGAFLPGSGDVWWTLTDDSDASSAAREVVRAIEDAAVPAMLAQMERQGQD